MKIGILGSGNMGRSLGILWAEQGHEIFFGGRTSEKGKVVAKVALICDYFSSYPYCC